MKRKLISGILTIVLVFCTSVPAYAADCRTEQNICRTELLEQILCRYTGSCGTAAEQPFDWNALLCRLFARTPAAAESRSEPRRPGEEGRTAGPARRAP